MTKQFNAILIGELKFYVYALIDPRNSEPFYIGKGEGNRVFAHAADAVESEQSTDKLEKIREIRAAGHDVKSVIIRHGLEEKAAFVLESVLIDFVRKFGAGLTNIAAGHHSSFYGIKSTDELKRQYDSPPLEHLEDGCVIININRRYREARDSKSFYDVTHEFWRMRNPTEQNLRYALAEFSGFIVDVFEIENWYRSPDGGRWGFNGKPAPRAVRDRYLNRKIYKARGTANPISYRLQART